MRQHSQLLPLALHFLVAAMLTISGVNSLTKKMVLKRAGQSTWSMLISRGHIGDWHAVLGLWHSTIQQHGHDGWMTWLLWLKDVLWQGSGKLAVSSMRREPKNDYSSCSSERFRVQGHKIKFITFLDFFYSRYETTALLHIWKQFIFSVLQSEAANLPAYVNTR